MVAEFINYFETIEDQRIILPALNLLSVLILSVFKSKKRVQKHVTTSVHYQLMPQK